MAQKKQPQSAVELARSAEIDAVLDQMYGYFSRETPPRVVWSTVETPCAA